MMSGDTTFGAMDSLPSREATGSQAEPASPLLRRVQAWAAVMLATRIVLGTMLSYALAPFAPAESHQPERLAFLEHMANSAPFGRTLLFNVAAGNSVFADPTVRGAVYLVGVVLASTAFAAVLRLLVRSRGEPDPRVTRTLLWTSVAVAIVAVLRYPSFTNDMWMSVAWGRMIVSHVNPYYHDFTPAAMDGIPFQSFPLHMTYGPLWAMITAALAWLSRSTVLGGYYLQKVLLAAAWVATLLVVHRLAARRSARHAAIAVCLFGWMPVSAGYAIGEGHNDVVLALGIGLFALGLLERRTALALAALTASILVKYVSLPLALIGLLYVVRLPAPERRRALLAGAVCAVAAALCFAMFWRGPGFFEPVETMQGWHFLTPSTVTGYLLRLVDLNVPQWLLDGVLLLAMTALAGAALGVWVKQPDEHRLLRAMLALLAVVLFCLVGHVWPWFTMWLLPLASVEFETAPVWLLLAFIWMEPILNLSWFMERDLRLVEPLGALSYGMAIAITLLLLAYRRRALATEPA